MKLKTSVALSEETLTKMRQLIREDRFRNKSHLMEYAIKKLIQDIK